MKKVAIACLIVVLLALASWVGLNYFDAQWSGIDKSVVEKVAAQAGHPPRKPFINTDQGDLLLFVFLIAGAAGGFLGGYYFRELFPPTPERREG